MRNKFISYSYQSLNLLLTPSNMRLTSPAFTNGNPIPPQYTCDGIDVNPQLDIADVPAGTKSLVLIVDDPDSIAGNWAHWLMWNIPTETKIIKEHAPVPGAVEGINSFGKTAWGGPCPHSGSHRYFFRLYALDTELNLSSSAGRSELDRAMEGHILESVVLIGTYQREMV